MNTVDNEGNTAAHYAAMHDHGDILEALLAHGTDLGIQNNIGQTVFDVAASVKIINILSSHF